MVSLVVLVICAGGSPSSQATISDFASNQLVNIVIGGIIAASASFLGIFLTSRQQFKRDNRAYQQQIEREQVAYTRSLKDAKRERLRSSYKVLLNAADTYQFEAQRHVNTPSAGNIALTDVDGAVTEVKLEDIDTDVLSIFFELRGAFHTFDAHLNTPAEGSWDEVVKQKRIVSEKYEQLTIAMNRHLKELES